MKGQGGTTRQEHAQLGAVLLLLTLLYTAGSFGLVSSNDGSHFAAVRALAERRTFRIDDGVIFALNDVALHNGDRYSNKAPGTALLAVPLYWLAAPLGTALQEPPREEETDWFWGLWDVARRHGMDFSTGQVSHAYETTRPAQDLLGLLSVLAGVLVCWAVYRLSRRLGTSHAAALVTVVTLGTGTLLWRYATALFSHALSAALLVVALEWLVSGRARRSSATAVAWGLLLGFSVAVEYQAVLTIPPLLAGWCWGVTGTTRPHETRRQLALVGAGVIVWALWLAWFHQAHFGGVFVTAPAASEYFAYAADAGEMFGASMLSGMRSLLLSSETHGLLYVSPVVLAAVAGWLCWPREERRWLWVTLAVVLLHSLVIFKLRSPEGGSSADHRYLVRILPLLILPVGFVVDRVVKAGRPAMLAGAGVAFVGLYTVSLVRNVEAMAHFMKHTVLLGADGAVHVDAVLPSATRLPLLGVAAVFFAAAYALGVAAESVAGDSTPRRAE